MKLRAMPSTRIARFTRLFACFVFCAAIFLAIPASAAAPPSNRWLFIVETSRAMQPRSDAAAQLVGNVILTRANGQMRAGDTIGMWTFNSDLRTGELSLQTLASNNVKQIAENTSLFLAMRKWERRVRLDKVITPMNTLITNSEFITVILISSGEKIRGTPFDAAINSVYGKFQTQQEKAKLPFVTVLRGQFGRAVDFKVTVPPAPVEWPPLPRELEIIAAPVQATNPPPPAPTPPPPPPPVAPPLIIHGKKPEPEMVSNPAPILKTNEAPAAATNQNVLSEVKTNTPENQPAPVATPASILTNSAAPAANLAATNLAASTATNSVSASVAPEKSADKKVFYVTALIAAAGIGLVVMLIRRSRSQSHVSLITRSLDRDEK